MMLSVLSNKRNHRALCWGQIDETAFRQAQTQNHATDKVQIGQNAQAIERLSTQGEKSNLSSFLVTLLSGRSL